MLVNRRSLIAGMASLLAAPAVVRAGSLMPVRTLAGPTVFLGEGLVFKEAGGGWVKATLTQKLKSPKFQFFDIGETIKFDNDASAFHVDWSEQGLQVRRRLGLSDVPAIKADQQERAHAFWLCEQHRQSLETIFGAAA